MPSSTSVGATLSPRPTTNFAICLMLMTYLSESSAVGGGTPANDWANWDGTVDGSTAGGLAGRRRGERGRQGGRRWHGETHAQP